MSGKTKAAKHPRSFGRAQLGMRLRQKGFSRREAKLAVNALLEAIWEGLERDGEVEFPLGKLKVVHHRHRQQEGIFLGRKRMIYGRRHTVVHELDEQGDKLLNPPPKPTPSRLVLPPLVLPPRPGTRTEQKQPAKKISARGRRKWISRAKVPEPPKENTLPKGNHKILLPPRPGFSGMQRPALGRDPNGKSGERIRRFELPPKPALEKRDREH